MIRKQDILDRAAEWGMRPDVVEKDYVLGWLLAAIAENAETQSAWIFKGGTCIKKCYFETYRFSEDLDFTLLPEASYTEAAIRETIINVATRAAELSGVEFPGERVEVRSMRNRQGEPTFQGRIAYRGPLGVPTFPRVLFDLTQYEPVIDEPALRSVFHPYPDGLPEGAGVATYSFNELLAEKTRALYQRARPRDLYDVVFLLENHPEAFDLAHVRDVFRQKCAAKQISELSSRDLLGMVSNAPELESEWENMLGHQLPRLPRLDDLKSRLAALLVWIDEPLAAVAASVREVPLGRQEAPLAPAGIQYWGTGVPLEAIRFAGANRLLVEFAYHGKHRRVEPYSLRRASTGNVLLYAWEQASGHVKAFNVAEIAGVQTTDTPFTPRYQIEFTTHGPVSAPAIAVSPRIRSQRRRVSSSRRHGTTYVFECTYCRKRFRHAKNDSALRKHKAKDSKWDCPGRRGYLVDTTWN